MPTVRRYRMEIELNRLPPLPPLPYGFRWRAWDVALLEAHALVKCHSFRRQLDTTIFPKLATLDGCRDLMRIISEMPGFVPTATWLLESPNGYCGTIQGIEEPVGVGAIQNVGVVPAYQALGLGKLLVLKALHGFSQAGVKRVFLEVTASNRPAVYLYHSVGFTIRKRFNFEPLTVSDILPIG